MSRADKLENELPQVFTPAAPISTPDFLKGRNAILEDIKRANRRKGASVVVYGERGVGKTSIAKVAAALVDGNHFYYSASPSDSFESITSSMLSYYKASWMPDARETSEITTTNAKASLQIISGGAEHQKRASAREVPLQATKLTPQEIASRMSKHEGIVIIDDFERILDAGARAQFSDLIKKFSDNEIHLSLMIVGIADNLMELLAAHESAQRSTVEIKVPRLSTENIRKIAVDGMARLNVAIGDDYVEQMAEFSANFPYYTHLLCEGAVTSLIQSLRNGTKTEVSIEQFELRNSIDYAIRNAAQSISQAYEDAIRNIRQSHRFKYTLYAIASSPEESVAYRDISRWVSAITKDTSGQVNVSHQLRSLEKSGMIEKPSRGFYRFKNPILRAFVILKARADTPENELAAIDAQIKYVGKRIERVKQRITGEQEN